MIEATEGRTYLANRSRPWLLAMRLGKDIMAMETQSRRDSSPHGILEGDRGREEEGKERERDRKRGRGRR